MEYRKNVPGTCEYCGSAFMAVSRRRRFCGDLCRRMAAHAAGRRPRPRTDASTPPVPGRHVLTCQYCHASFTAKRRDSLYCTARCQRRVCSERRISDGRLKIATEKARSRRQAWRRANKHCYDDRVRGAWVASVDPDEILARDGWRCGLCGYKVRRNCAYNHPKAPTIDHIVPLSRGGTHEPANVQAAHRRCNVRKNASGGGEQLALI